jgi:hypothetical protein
MVMTGSKDRGITGQGPQEKLDPYSYAPPGDKYGVNIDGASHFSFSGRAVTSPETLKRRPTLLGNVREIHAEEEKRIFDAVDSTSLLFWNAYLKGDNDAKALLQSAAVPEHSGGIVHLQWK